MSVIRCPTQLFAAAALILSAIGPAPAQPLPPNTIHIEHWPQDVPCRVLKKYPDGTWEITVPYTLYYALHTSTKFKNLGVTAYWDRKCRVQPQR